MINTSKPDERLRQAQQRLELHQYQMASKLGFRAINLRCTGVFMVQNF